MLSVCHRAIFVTRCLNIIPIIKCGIKLLIHSQTAISGASIKVGEWINFMDIWLLIHAVNKINSCLKIGLLVVSHANCVFLYHTETWCCLNISLTRDSSNGLSPDWHRDVTWTNADWLSGSHRGTSFKEIQIKHQVYNCANAFEKVLCEICCHFVQASKFLWPLL